MFEEKIIKKINEFNFDLLNKNIVFTNGCFDIIHPGHLNYLYKSSLEGELLIVGLNSDSSVKLNKGDNRPINSSEQRSAVLSFFNFIDYIIIFEEETPLNLIKKINPDILVKGSDYALEDIVGANHVINNGGSVKTLDFIDGFSSSGIIKKINNNK